MTRTLLAVFLLAVTAQAQEGVPSINSIMRFSNCSGPTEHAEQ